VSVNAEELGLLTCAEVRALLKISEPKLYELLNSGEIGSLKIGRARRIPISEVERYIAERMSGGDAA
jgi:excisionase family DNA binding protein